jgi:uncharacterized protein YjbJ (UPF0337 family)
MAARLEGLHEHKLQESYGYNLDKAKDEVDTFLKACK